MDTYLITVPVEADEESAGYLLERLLSFFEGTSGVNYYGGAAAINISRLSNDEVAAIQRDALERRTERSTNVRN